MSSLQFRTRPQKPRTRNRRDHSIRVLVAFGLILLCFCLLVARFVWLQVVKHEDFMVQATQNRISLIPTPPTRGEIADDDLEQVTAGACWGNFSDYGP